MPAPLILDEVHPLKLSMTGEISLFVHLRYGVSVSVLVWMVTYRPAPELA
jgi:hypothetical protein